MGIVRFDHIARECRDTFKGSLKNVPIVGLEHIEPYDMLLNNYDVNVETTFTKSFKQGQILFGRRRAYQHKACVATFDGVCSGDITVIEPIDGRVYRDLLPFIVQNDDFFEHAIKGSNGALSPRVKWQHMANYEVNLPDSDRQKELADKLWAAYEVKQSYLKMIGAIDEMVKAQFAEDYYYRYEPVDLGKHISVIRGVSYKPSDVKESADNSVAILRSNNISDGEINYDDLVYVSTACVSEKQFVNTGDIVMCGSNGSKKLVGKAGLITEEQTSTSFGAFCLGIRCKESLAPEYLNAFFNSQMYRSVIEELGNGTNIINIRPDHITSLRLPVPELVVQKEFVKLSQQADKSKFELRKSIEAIDKVIKSLINENL